MDNQAADALGCPDTPPEWLAQWPGVEALQSSFASGIRAYAGRVLRQEKERNLSWRADRLVLRIGSQRATWQLRGSQWQPSCTCGYSQGRCPHCFGAAKLFQEVAEARGWLGKDAAESAEAASTAPPPRARQRRVRSSTARTQLQFEWDTTPAEAAKLTVEVDVHHEPGVYVLRFYRDGESRFWMPLQTLYNLCQRAKGARLDNWPERDVRFLAWLGQHLKRRSLLRSNVKVLKLKPEEFERWQDRWAEDAGRFIERDSQQPFGRGRDAAFHFELSDAGERVTIAAMVTLADGTALPYHELLAKMSAGRDQFMVNGQMMRLAPPVSWDLLTSVFAKKSPTMDRRHVVDHLPHLLEQRLDLVRGDAVEAQTRRATAAVTLAPDGANFAGRIALDGQPFHPETGYAVGPIKVKKRRFQIILHETGDRDALRAFLRRTEAETGDDGTFRISGSREGARRLVAAWQRLPGTVDKRPSEKLLSLLEGVGPATAQVQQTISGAAVEFDVFWECDGRTLTGGEMRDLVRSEEGILRTASGEWLRMTAEDAAETAKRFEAVQEVEGTRMLIPEARRAAAAITGTAGAELNGLDRTGRSSLLTAPAPESPCVPDSLTDILRSYQRDGFAFMAERLAFRTGPLLADDMGLGKTLQVLSVLEAMRRNGGLPGFAESAAADLRFRALVVCPASVTAVWRHEAERFCPELRCATYRGTPEQRAAILDADDEWDVLIANYALIRQDQERFESAFFDVVVLDEAQAIKNPDAQITRAVKAVPRHCGLALTGTPLENRILDLWSICDFLNPGFLGSRAEFEEEFVSGTPDAGPRLASRIRPVLMRRTKGEVASELPPLTQEVISVEMTEEQRVAYQRELVRAREAVKMRGPIELLAALTRLRQICCHPELLPSGSGGDSGKLDELVAMLEELTAEGHSALVFSQFVTMLELMAPRIEEAGMPVFMITGKTPVERRAERIRQFSEAEEPGVFLLSLRAAGTGITLTKADYVFIYDPWWNPAVERQAIDRTHRIGQEQPVMAYRMIAADSVEERVLALQQEKAELFQQVVGAAEDAVPEGLSRDDLEALLQ